jgi:hypothetical protein
MPLPKPTQPRVKSKYEADGKIVIESFEGHLMEADIVDETHLINRLLATPQDLFVVPKTEWERYQEAVALLESIRQVIMSYPHPKLRVNLG